MFFVCYLGDYMPKVYDDEKLKEQALKLRAEGLSYEKIAKEIGVSKSKVYQLIGEYEKDRKKKSGEITAKLAELEKRVEEFEKEMNNKINKINKKY